MKRYKDLFFDLDDTLWDFERNSEETLKELYHRFLAQELGEENCPLFLSTYHRINESLWNEYKLNRIKKTEVAYLRFLYTLEESGSNNVSLARLLAEEYIRSSPTKTNLIPGATEVLESLIREYKLHIITNGFTEVQIPKLLNSGIRHYFTTLTTSEEAGCLKPCSQIFRFALEKAKAQINQSLMIGDDPEGDIRGARQIGLDTVFFVKDSKNLQIESTYTIFELRELLQILS
ncbi:MAG: YjjG family noncanonical pyrimidine nucleotidase [Lentimicrobium sp.]